MYVRRRLIALAIVLSFIAGIVAGALALSHGSSGGGSAAVGLAQKRKPSSLRRQPPPEEIRGVHVSMALASLPGKLDRYFAMERQGLNTIELDIKDETGQVAFPARSAPLAARIGAAKRYYNPRTVSIRAHARGIYLIGRVVVFEDPYLAENRSDRAVQYADGSVWHTYGGLGWTNPYDRKVWRYNVGIAEAAARAGFDEIQFDYVRFPSDGDISAMVFPGRRHERKGETIASFVRYASSRLHPLGARVSADVFGLAAHRDLGIGQVPRVLGRYLDAISPMVYPSHYVPGEYQIPNPDVAPGPTVYRSLRDFQRQLRGRKARLVPWLQSFSLGRTYTLEDLRAQVEAAKQAKASGFLFWNPEGTYNSRSLRASPGY
jgi:hypothetical protein